MSKSNQPKKSAKRLSRTQEIKQFLAYAEREFETKLTIEGYRWTESGLNSLIRSYVRNGTECGSLKTKSGDHDDYGDVPDVFCEFITTLSVEDLGESGEPQDDVLEEVRLMMRDLREAFPDDGEMKIAHLCICDMIRSIAAGSPSLSPEKFIMFFDPILDAYRAFRQELKGE